MVAELTEQIFGVFHIPPRIVALFLQPRTFALRFADEVREHFGRKGTLATNGFYHLRFEQGQVIARLAVIGIQHNQPRLAQFQFIGIFCVDHLAFGYPSHLGKNILDDRVHDIVQNVHGVTGLPVAFGLLAGLAVTDVAQPLGGVQRAVGAFAVPPVGAEQ